MNSFSQNLLFPSSEPTTMNFEDSDPYKFVGLEWSTYFARLSSAVAYLIQIKKSQQLQA